MIIIKFLYLIYDHLTVQKIGSTTDLAQQWENLVKQKAKEIIITREKNKIIMKGKLPGQ